MGFGCHSGLRIVFKCCLGFGLMSATFFMHWPRLESTTFFFFLFFFEKPDPGPIKNSKKENYKTSLVTRGARSSGIEPNQTCSSIPDLERLARK